MKPIILKGPQRLHTATLKGLWSPDAPNGHIYFDGVVPLLMGFLNVKL